MERSRGRTSGERVTGRRRRERARADVVRAAIRLAERAPFRDLTVEEIAAAAGLSRSAFYLHFRDKADLLLTALEEVAGELIGVADGWWRGGSGSPADRVREALADLTSAYAANASVLRLAAEASTYDEEVGDAWAAIVGRFVIATADHIAAEQERGLISARVDPRPTAEALVLMAERCCWVHLAGGRRSPGAVAGQLAPVWTAALYPDVVPAEELRPPAEAA